MAALGIPLDGDARARLLAFAALLRQWNRAHNLVSRADVDRLVARHIVDSLALLPFVTPGRLVDLGSGAGLPGIPLALVRADVAVTLVERRATKAAFLRHAGSVLGLPALDVRAVDATRPPSAPFPQATVRAVATGGPLARIAVPWLADHGRLLLMLGARQDASAQPPGFRMLREHAYQLPGIAARLRVAEFERLPVRSAHAAAAAD